jgi:hypothetical protein
LAKVKQESKKEDKNFKKDCSKAHKLLTDYDRLMQKQGKNLSPQKLEELNKLRNLGTITSNHLPGSLQREFPARFQEMKLKEVNEECGKK